MSLDPGREEALQVLLEDLQRENDELRAELAAAQLPPDGDGVPFDTRPPTAVPFVYATVEEWFNDVFVPLSGGMTRWCQQWWEHPQAWWRINALWRSWEHHRHDAGLGRSSWLRDFDYHLDRLQTSRTFAGCAVNHSPETPTAQPAPRFIGPAA